MTIANTVASKLFVGFVAIAMALTLVAPAQAQTEAELQAQIDSLMATINALQSQLGQTTTTGGGSSASVCPYAWTRALSTGSTGADVMALQKFLNADPATMIAATGVGSAGMETDYYGGLTAAAVSNFQVKYRDTILTPLGLVNPTGYFGQSSIAKANELCAAAPVMDDDDMMDDDDDMMDDDDEDFELSGEASLDTFEVDDAADDDIEEGQEDAPIAEVTVEFTDGDAEISRLDIQLLGSGQSDTATIRPWDAFETISLWVDGDKVAEMDADDEDDYLDEDLGTLRFSNLDIIGEEDEEVEITVAATVQTGLDSEELTTWVFSAESMRFFDADGVATTEDGSVVTGDSASFTIDVEGGDDELVVRTSSSDPDATTLRVEDDSDSDWYTIFVFDLDTDDSVNDIELNSIPVSFTVGSGTVADFIDDVEIVIDGTTIDDYDWGSDGATRIATFDVDGDVVIDAGDRVEVEVMAKFNSIETGSADEGTTVRAAVTAANANAIQAEGADDLDNTSPDQLTGAAEGELHTLRTQGIDVSIDSTDAEVTVVDSADNDYATFEIVLDVTAFEQEVYIPINAASTTWKLVDGNGADLLTSDTASTTVVITSSAEEGGSGDAFFEINEGQTETVTITVTYTPGSVTPQSARLQLLTLSFDETGTGTATDDSTWTALPANDYRTSTVTIQD